MAQNEYALFNTITDFYNWQGTDGTPHADLSSSHVNKHFEFPNTVGTKRMYEPHVHPGSVFNFGSGSSSDVYVSHVSGDPRVYCFIQTRHPDHLLHNSHVSREWLVDNGFILAGE